MSKAYTEATLQQELTENFTWRLKEISSMAFLLREAKDPNKQVLARAAVTVLYAHWEGYVKFCADKYLQFVASRRRKVNELKPSFSVLYLEGKFGAVMSKGLSIADKVRVIAEVAEISEKIMSNPGKSYVSTRSNLKYDVLVEICDAIGVDERIGAENATFIDKDLLMTRNMIAHGQASKVDSEKFQEMSHRVLGMMRQFRNHIENAAARRGYMR